MTKNSTAVQKFYPGSGFSKLSEEMHFTAETQWTRRSQSKGCILSDYLCVLAPPR